MDEMKDNQIPEEVISEEQTGGYVPRPAWQVRAARVALIFVILFVIYQILSIATGGR